MPLRFILFFLVAFSVLGGGHLYLYRRLVRDTEPGRAARLAGAALLALLVVTMVGQRLIDRVIPGDWPVQASLLAWYWFALATYLVLTLLTLDAAHGVAALVRRLRARRQARAAALTPHTVTPPTAAHTPGSTTPPTAARAPGPAATSTAAALTPGSTTPPTVAPAPGPTATPAAAAPLHVPLVHPAPEPTDAPADPARRRFLARAGAGAALAVGGGLTSYGVWRAYRPQVVSDVVVRLPGLPRTLEGFSIVQVSDIHVGPLIRRAFMDDLVARVNALRPDLVAVTGDLVDGTVRTLGPSVAALQELRSRHGTYFVHGNHEYYSDDVAWDAALGRMGVTTLRNRHVRIGEGRDGFDLAGVDDWSARRSGFPRAYDLERALAGRDPARAAVLLAHQPANWREAARAGVGLQLSGHTHGGQFFPFTLAISAVWEHAAGLYQEGGSSLYVNRGTGFWGPPVRVGSEPEITRLVLLPA